MKNVIFGLLLLFSISLWGQAPAPATLIDSSIPLPGGSTAVYTGSGLSYYRHADGLGSHRVLSSSTAGQPYYDTAFAPYGEDYANAPGSCPSCVGSAEFTTSFMPQNDGTAGGLSAPWGALYNTPTRTYSAVQGRWLSPDQFMDVTNPSSANPYAFASNSPLLRSDSQGTQDDGGDDCGDDGCGGGISWSSGDLWNSDWGWGWSDFGGGISGWFTTISTWWNSTPTGPTTGNLRDDWQMQMYIYHGAALPGVTPGESVSATVNADTWLSLTGDYEPVCSGCKVRWGDVKLAKTLTTAWTVGLTGGFSAGGGLDQAFVDSIAVARTESGAVTAETAIGANVPAEPKIIGTAIGDTDFVEVYHGTNSKYREIMADGLSARRPGPVYVSTDIRAAQNAVKYHGDVVTGKVMPGNSGIVTSRIPSGLYYKYYQPFQRPYPGFFTPNADSLTGANYEPLSTEIPLRYEIQVTIFNRYRLWP